MLQKWMMLWQNSKPLFLKIFFFLFFLWPRRSWYVQGSSDFISISHERVSRPLLETRTFFQTGFVFIVVVCCETFPFDCNAKRHRSFQAGRYWRGEHLQVFFEEETMRKWAREKKKSRRNTRERGKQQNFFFFSIFQFFFLVFFGFWLNDLTFFLL